jgi:3-methyladenine DNA glycosylase AlkD
VRPNPSAEQIVRAVGTSHTAPTVRRAVRSCVREWKACRPRDVAIVALELGRRGNLWWASEILEAAPTARSTLRSREIEQLAREMDSWASVDAFSCFAVGPAWREGIVSDVLIARWARSSNRWLRRAALVSTVPLNTLSRDGTGDARRTLAVCAKLVDDRDDMVVKALSWALRVLSKVDAPAVRAFLEKHRNDLARLVVREVETKLATGVKRRRRDR